MSFLNLTGLHAFLTLHCAAAGDRLHSASPVPAFPLPLASRSRMRQPSVVRVPDAVGFLSPQELPRRLHTRGSRTRAPSAKFPTSVFPSACHTTLIQSQLSQLICGWGGSLESLDMSGCDFRSSTFADDAFRMVAVKRLILRGAKGEHLIPVVRGVSE
jgi:hypothetical protein